jgi:hypothetical protein
MNRWLRSLVLSASLACVATAQALPFGTLEFMQRTGVVAPTDEIEIWMRFTLNPGSPALNFTSNPLSGFGSEVPTHGTRYDPATNTFLQVPFAPGSVHEAMLQSWYGCQTTFFTGCFGPGEYSLTWGGDEPGHPNPDRDTSYNLQPGDSVEYLLGTLTPKAGGAAAGLYRWGITGFQIVFSGLDDNGDALFAYHGMANTCAANTDDCAFLREVRALSAPGAAALVLLGLAGVVWSRQRRK